MYNTSFSSSSSSSNNNNNNNGSGSGSSNSNSNSLLTNNNPHLTDENRNLFRLKVDLLKKVLRMCALPVSGNKAVLTTRIGDHLKSSMLKYNSSRGMVKNTVAVELKRVHEAINNLAIYGSVTQMNPNPNGMGLPRSPKSGIIKLKRPGVNEVLGISPSSSSSSSSYMNFNNNNNNINISQVISAKSDCICLSQHATNNDVHCQVCAIRFHKHCHMITLTPLNHNEFQCVTCWSKMINPFIKVEETLLGPFKFNHPSKQYPVTKGFRLTQQHFNDFNKPGKKVLLRAFMIDEDMNNLSKKSDKNVKERKDHANASILPQFEVHQWPLETVLKCNSTTLPIKQRHVYYHGERKWKGLSEPVDIRNYLRLGPNQLQIYGSQDKCEYVFILQTVHVKTVEEVKQEVIKYNEKNGVTEEECLQKVKNTFKMCAIVDSDDSDDEEEELMDMITRLSIKCPLGLCQIKIPVKGVKCTHLQCFDLETFLSFNSNSQSGGWKCGVCHKKLSIKDIQIDSYISKIIKEIEKNMSSKKIDDEDLDTIEINNKGEWKLVSSATLKMNQQMRRIESNDSKKGVEPSKSSFNSINVDVLDDDDDDPFNINNNNGNVNNNNNNNTNQNSNNNNNTTSSNSSSRNQPTAQDFVDLTFSSDEEDDVVIQQSTTQPVAAGGGLLPLPVFSNFFENNNNNNNNSTTSNTLSSLQPPQKKQRMMLPVNNALLPDSSNNNNNNTNDMNDFNNFFMH